MEGKNESYAQSGVAVINEIIDSLDMLSVVKSLREVDEYTQNNSLEKYEEWLPK